MGKEQLTFPQIHLTTDLQTTSVEQMVLMFQVHIQVRKEYISGLEKTWMTTEETETQLKH